MPLKNYLLLPPSQKGCYPVKELARLDFSKYFSLPSQACNENVEAQPRRTGVHSQKLRRTSGVHVPRFADWPPDRAEAPL